MRHDPRLRPRRRHDLRRPARVSDGSSRAARDDRHAVGDSQDAACTRGWPRKGGSTRNSESEFGTNVIPARMSREELRDGYVQLMQDLYEPNGLLRPVGRSVCARQLSLQPNTGRVLAATSVVWSERERDPSRSLRHSSTGNSCKECLKLSAARVSSADRRLPSHAPRSCRAVCLSSEVCHPLSCTHHGPKHGCSAAPYREFVLTILGRRKCHSERSSTT